MSAVSSPSGVWSGVSAKVYMYNVNVAATPRSRLGIGLKVKDLVVVHIPGYNVYVNSQLCRAKRTWHVG